MPHDVEMATYALMAYSWGLLGFSLVKVLAPGYFARQDTKTPVRVGLIALGVNMALNAAVVLAAPSSSDFPYPHILIATSTCIAAAINTTLLWIGLKRQGVYKARPGWGALARARARAPMPPWPRLLIWLGGDLQGWMALNALDRALPAGPLHRWRPPAPTSRCCSSRACVCATCATWRGHNPPWNSSVACRA